MTGHEWDRLLHAYGLATDTPQQLAAITGDDDDAADRAFEHLWNAVLHQGSIYTATGPVVTWLSEAVADALIPDRIHLERTTREGEAIAFLAEAYRSAASVTRPVAISPERLAQLDRAIAGFDPQTFYRDDELVGDLMAHAITDLLARAPAAAEAALSVLERGDPALTVGAIDLLAQAARAGTHLTEAASVLRARATTPDDLTRLTAVIALGELGLDTSAFFEDAALGVRVAAALAPGAATDPRAFDLLAEAALEPAAVDAAFDPRPPQLDEFGRFLVIAALCDRTTSFEDVLPAALACVPLASPYTVEYDWGVFLKTARRLGLEPSLKPFATYLEALVDRKDLWNPRNANAESLFRSADLPYDRKACMRIVGRRRLFG